VPPVRRFLQDSGLPNGQDAAAERPKFAEPIKALLKQEPSFGYQIAAAFVAELVGMSKNMMQRVFQLNGWQVPTGAIGGRLRVGMVACAATVKDQRWDTDLDRICGGREDWLTLPLSIDWHSLKSWGRLHLKAKRLPLRHPRWSEP
jgi:putative transposase